jgi:TRAP-type C4-dicarboxylate transport system substrate-binding protein
MAATGMLSRLKGARLAAILGIAELAMLGKAHWEHLTPTEQQELRRLMRKAGVRPDRNLAKREQTRLRGLVAKLELFDFAKKAGPTFVGLRGRKKP